MSKSDRIIAFQTRVITLQLFFLFHNDTGFPHNRYDTVGYIDSEDEFRRYVYSVKRKTTAVFFGKELLVKFAAHGPNLIPPK
jgi:hypothetical protein